MRRITSKNTSPELAVRKMLFREGYRYRLHRQDLPGKPDIVFGRLRKLIFVHGCFWHAHTCQKAHQPKTNQAYWSPKLKRNKERDARYLEELKVTGWQVLTIWECELKDFGRIEQKIFRFLNGKTGQKKAKIIARNRTPILPVSWADRRARENGPKP